MEAKGTPKKGDLDLTSLIWCLSNTDMLGYVANMHL